MEQTPYWMWTKRKSNTTSTQQQRQQQQQQQQQQFQAGGSTKTSMSYNNDSSWEEQAFAEDAIGAFGGGGCVWPPRSYSCSFCRREFRSAQALGGHMNVHRRDRARLKQSSPPHHHHQSQLDHNINQNHLLGFDQYHHHYQPNPNHPILASSWTSRVCDNDQEISKRSPIFSSSPTTWANFVVGRSSDNKTSDDPKPQGCNKAKCVRTDLSVSLNLVLHQTHDPTMSSEEDEHDEEAMRRCKKKRRRNSIDASSSSFPFFLKPTHQAHDDHDEADDEHSPKPTSEDLDLELRLGRSP